jgi:hypothetical protein
MICIDEKNPNDCKKEPHDLTHAPDAMRYFAIYYHEKSEGPREEVGRRRMWSEDLWEDYCDASEEVQALIISRHGMPSNYDI